MDFDPRFALLATNRKNIRIQMNIKIGMISTNSIAQRTLIVAVVVWRCQLLKNYGNVH